MRGRWLTAARVLLAISVAAAAVILANVALLGVAEGKDEPVGKLRPGVVLVPTSSEPTDDVGANPAPAPATTASDTSGAEDNGGQDSGDRNESSEADRDD